MAGSFSMPMMALGSTTMMLDGQRQTKVKNQNLEYFNQRKNALEHQHAADVRQQEERLERVKASHRARMSASGVAPDEGSSEAVLDGLESATQKQINDRGAEHNLAISRLNNGAYASVDKSISPTTNCWRCVATRTWPGPRTAPSGAPSSTRGITAAARSASTCPNRSTRPSSSW